MNLICQFCRAILHKTFLHSIFEAPGTNAYHTIVLAFIYRDLRWVSNTSMYLVQNMLFLLKGLYIYVEDHSETHIPGNKSYLNIVWGNYKVLKKDGAESKSSESSLNCSKLKKYEGLQ